MAFVRVASLGELPEGELLAVEADGVRICLARAEEAVYAFADNCSHRDFPLSQGEFDTDECVVTCEWHGAEFDVCTGAARTLPATRGLRTYETRVRDGRIHVVLEDAG